MQRLTPIVIALLVATPVVTAQSSSVTLGIHRAVGDGIPAPLTSSAGDAARGLNLALDAQQGNCVACHQLPLPGHQAVGDIGPSLVGVGSRLTEAQIRFRVIDPKRLNPETPMPAYYKTDGLHRVDPRYEGRSILDAQSIEDVIAYLRTLQ